MATAATLIFLAVFVWICFRSARRLATKDSAMESSAGWIYFIAGEGGPVKIGMSSHEPTSQRLPELRTMSPIPLKVVFKAPVDDRYKAERALHAELAPYRERGEWFDRDAALAYADHLRTVLEGSN
jgi:hypothetical protein